MAASSGWRAVGLWFDAATWSDATTADVAARLADTGLTALDIEPVILGRGADAGEQLVDAAGALGVPFLLVAGGPASHAEAVERVGALCAYAAQAAPRLTVVLEFLPIFTIGTMAAAVAVVDEVGAGNSGVLVDTLHLARSGGSAAELGALAAARPGLFPYLQLADAGALAPVGATALREEALHGRLLPGEGDLPLDEMIAAVPGVPVSVELRSRALMEGYPDPVERARVIRRSLSSLAP